MTPPGAALNRLDQLAADHLPPHSDLAVRSLVGVVHLDTRQLDAHLLGQQNEQTSQAQRLTRLERRLALIERNLQTPYD